MGYIFWALAIFTMVVFAPLFYIYMMYGPEVFKHMMDENERKSREMFRKRGWFKTGMKIMDEEEERKKERRELRLKAGLPPEEEEDADDRRNT